MLESRNTAHLVVAAFVALGIGVSTYAGEDPATGKCPLGKTPEEIAQVQSISGRVVKISDGDTLKITDSKTTYAIRLLSIDTPETHYQGQTQGYWGDQAAAKAAKLLPLGTEVTVELDVEKCDMYGRVLGYVFVGKTFVNEKLVEEGLAVNYCIYPNVKYCDRLAPTVAKNIQAGKGMFSDPKLQLPYDFRRELSGRPYEKYVGNIYSHVVLKPELQDKVPVAERVFFMNEKAIAAPYHLEQGAR